MSSTALPLHGPPAWSTALAELDGWCLHLRCPACGRITIPSCRMLGAAHGPLTLATVLRRFRSRCCRASLDELLLAVRADAGAFGIPDHPWGFRCSFRRADVPETPAKTSTKT